MILLMQENDKQHNTHSILYVSWNTPYHAVPF